MNNQAVQTKKQENTRLPWKMYVLLVGISIMTIAIIIFGFSQSNEMITRYGPLMHSSVLIKAEATSAHLWFEEIVSGDINEEIQIVWVHLDRANWFAKAMLDGGSNEHDTILPLKNQDLRRKMELVIKKLETFEGISRVRLDAVEVSGIGSDIDQRFDAVFADLIKHLDNTDKTLHEVIRRKNANFRFLQSILILLAFMFSASIGLGFYRFERRQARDMETILKSKENIEREMQGRIRAEQKLALTNLELVDKNKELEQIVYVTSHDLRSPLVNIQGFSQELRNSIEDLKTVLSRQETASGIRQESEAILSEDIPEALNYIGTSVTKIDNLLAGLLKMSRLGRQALHIQKLNMQDIVSEVIESFEFQIKQAGLKVVLGDIPDAYGDETQVNQVFSNLIENALKFRDAEKEGLITISGKNNGQRAEICVEDNGLGISKEHQSVIFEIFHQLNPGNSPGQGLGLTIVQRVLDRCSGSIWVESELGRGSKFFVALPNQATV